MDRQANGAASPHVEAGMEMARAELGEGGRETDVAIQRIAEVSLRKFLGMNEGRGEAEQKACQER